MTTQPTTNTRKRFKFTIELDTEAMSQDEYSERIEEMDADEAASEMMYSMCNSLYESFCPSFTGEYENGPIKVVINKMEIINE